MGNDRVTFQGRFGGVAHSLSIPLQNILAVYARENGQGMAFEPESEPSDDDAMSASHEERAILEAVDLKSVEGDESETPDSSDSPEPPEPPHTPPPTGGRARLKLVK
jgi:stringent starvation protein B